jgi:hypothetical protein
MTRDDIVGMVHEAVAQTNGDDNVMDTPDWLEHFANLVAAAEREACARVCEINQMNSYACAQLIRARSQS